MFPQNVFQTLSLMRVLLFMNDNDLYDILHEFVLCKDESGEFIPVNKVIKSLLTKYKEVITENIETQKILISFCAQNSCNRKTDYGSPRDLAELARDMYTQKSREAEEFLRKKENYRDAFYTSIEDNAEIRMNLTKCFESGTCLNLTIKQLVRKLLEQHNEREKTK